jgi:hypothetical protein
VKTAAVHPLVASYADSVACMRTSGHDVALGLRDADKRRDYYADHGFLGYAFRAISCETLGRFSPGATQFEFLFESSHATFTQPACFANVCKAN